MNNTSSKIIKKYKTMSFRTERASAHSARANDVAESNLETKFKSRLLDKGCHTSNQKLVRCSIFNIQHSNFESRISNIKLNPTFKSNVENRISNSISHSNFECGISKIKLNPTFKSNVEYRISNSIQHSNRMSNIEYQTQSYIQIKCRISNIKLNPTFKSNVEYQTKSHIEIECRISNIQLNLTFKF